MPRDAPLELRFDRYLLPRTATRDSIRVYSGRPENAVFLEQHYDVVERVVRFRPFGGIWQPGLLYTVVIEPPDPDDWRSPGFRAFDGAGLEGGDVPLEFSFRTARLAPTRPTPPEEIPIDCSTFLDDVTASGCNRAGCHTGSEAPMGLRLDSASSLRATAIRQVARETEIAGAIGEGLVDPPRFGASMPIIDPGSAPNSYLIYKLLAKVENFGSSEQACRSAYSVAFAPGSCVPASFEERQRLRSWFVAHEPMPPGAESIDRAVLDRLVRFVAQGAQCP